MKLTVPRGFRVTLPEWGRGVFHHCGEELDRRAWRRAMPHVPA
jgi:hypothetical protein